MYKTVPFNGQYCFSHFHKVLVSIVTLDCIGIIQLVYVHHAATQILLSFYNVLHVAT